MMTHLRLALAASGLWLIAAAAAAGLLMAMGPGTGVFLALGLIAGIAGAATLILALHHDAEARAETVRLVRDCGDSSGAFEGLAALERALSKRVDNAEQIEAGFGATGHRMVFLDREGAVIAASEGLRALMPELVPGADAVPVFGLETEDGEPSQLVALNGRRYAVVRRPVGDGPVLIELYPAGHYLEDDDLDAFEAALAGGQTGFRFEADAAAAHPGLAALNGAIETIDQLLAACEGVLTGRDADAGLHPEHRVRIVAIAEALRQREAARDEEVERVRDLRERLEDARHIIERQAAEADIATELADATRADLGEAAEALETGALHAQQLALGGRALAGMASGADAAAMRSGAAVDLVAALIGDIDEMVASIEDISIRTNRLALNATVEAARGGTDAGLAVADEVRQLAQLTNRSAKDIRGAISRSRAQAVLGREEADSVRKMVAAFDENLRKIRNETDTIAKALGDSGDCLKRLDTRLGGIEHAEPAEGVVDNERRLAS